MMYQPAGRVTLASEAVVASTTGFRTGGLLVVVPTLGGKKLGWNDFMPDSQHSGTGSLTRQPSSSQRLSLSSFAAFPPLAMEAEQLHSCPGAARDSGLPG